MVGNGVNCIAFPVGNSLGKSLAATPWLARVLKSPDRCTPDTSAAGNAPCTGLNIVMLVQSMSDISEVRNQLPYTGQLERNGFRSRTNRHLVSLCCSRQNKSAKTTV